MHPKVILNGKLTDATRARLPLASSAHLHGRGVFTTVALYGGRPCSGRCTGRVCARAPSGSGSNSRPRPKRQCAQTSWADRGPRRRAGRARVTLLARASRGLWKLAGGGLRCLRLLLDDGRGPRGRQRSRRAHRLTPPLNSSRRSSAYQERQLPEPVLAWEEARARDFDEAVRVNERGEVVSAAMANIFWVAEGRIHTPALSVGALAGTTRDCCIDIARELAVPLVEGVYALHDLGEADEIFLTSAGPRREPRPPPSTSHLQPSRRSVAARGARRFRHLDL